MEATYFRMRVHRFWCSETSNSMLQFTRTHTSIMQHLTTRCLYAPIIHLRALLILLNTSILCKCMYLCAAVSSIQTILSFLVCAFGFKFCIHTNTYYGIDVYKHQRWCLLPLKWQLTQMNWFCQNVVLKFVDLRGISQYLIK